jgi:CheY-like chemotaxis protein
MLFSGSDQGEPAKAPRPLRVIVADDDRDTVLTLMMLLREEGHDVKGVHSGADVLKSLDAFEPDAVFLDISMPDVSGYEVAKRIIAKRGRRKPLLIGLSGIYRKSPDFLLAQAVGFDHYVTKPYEPSYVLKLLAPLRLPRAET